MFLNLTHCFILTFSQCHLVNWGVEIDLSMYEIIQIWDLFTEFKLSQSFLSCALRRDLTIVRAGVAKIP